MNTDILDSVGELFTNSLIGFGIDENTARCKTAGIIEELALLFGGQLVYIKKTRNPNAVAERNSFIVADYDGNNTKDLARKYQLSQATIYQIVKAAT
jgi:Mor family transcriptional regulator